MKLAFCLFNYFPYGGLQRDFLNIAQAALQRGHSIDVYTMCWEGPSALHLKIHIIKVKGLQNHTRRKNFVYQIKPYLETGHYDLIVGFNKMPGLDVYYAADTCYQAKARKQHSGIYRLTARYRQSVNYEKIVFAPESKTQILLLAKLQQEEFMTYYHTPLKRFHLLPPGIAQDRIATKDAHQKRDLLRKEYGLDCNDLLLLMVGSGFKTKGVDRTLLAYAALPSSLKNRTRVFIIGEDDSVPFKRQAKQLGIGERVLFLGGRDDVPRFLLGADLLLHPAYNENTGTVILEAMTAGLPVLTTDVCGYAQYVIQADAGYVLSSFTQAQFNETLVNMLLSQKRLIWKANALAFVKTADIYSMPERALTIIESLNKS